MKLTQLVAQYVEFRKGMGQAFGSDEGILRAFSRAVGDGRHICHVGEGEVAAFLAGHGYVTRNWHRKYTALRGFFHYALSRGHLLASPLPTTVPKQPERFVPYIYSIDELRRLLDGTASCQRQPNLLAPDTFRTILLLLYGAALRVSEALSLTLADVDLREAVLTIRDTKFYKTRLVLPWKRTE
jgi:site-specific recombinase XerD